MPAAALCGLASVSQAPKEVEIVQSSLGDEMVLFTEESEMIRSPQESEIV